MFDVGFLEILVIMVIALIVIGPERMPEVARKIGQFTGKTKRFINSMKQDSEITQTMNEIQNSMNLDEQKKEIESITSSLQEDLSRLENEWDVELDKDISRPFAKDEAQTAAGNQFNKAPQQPVIPQAQEQVAQSEQTATETDPAITPSPETPKSTT